MIKNTVSDVFSLEALKKDIKRAFNELIISGEDTQIRVCTLVSGGVIVYMLYMFIKHIIYIYS